jgi:hypothetical protein
MQKSEQIGQLVAALAKAHAQFKTIGKDKTAKIQSAKGAFSYTYADLATVIDATLPALSANGLAVVQPVRLAEGQIVVTTILAHSSGEWISEEMSWPVADTDNRSIGSGVTYARRHSYLAVIGAASTDEDDDAQSARGGDHETAKPQSRTASVAAKVAAANGTDRLGAIKAGLERFGLKSSDARKAKAESILGHPFDTKNDSDLTALEAWIREKNDATEILGRAENEKQAEFDQRVQ